MVGFKTSLYVAGALTDRDDHGMVISHDAKPRQHTNPRIRDILGGGESVSFLPLPGKGVS